MADRPLGWIEAVETGSELSRKSQTLTTPSKLAQGKHLQGVSIGTRYKMLREPHWDAPARNECVAALLEPNVRHPAVVSIVRPHERFFGRAALVEQLDGTVSQSGSEDRTIRLGREGCDRTVGLGRDVLKVIHIKLGMSASRTGDPKTRRRGGRGREGWRTDRLRQFSVRVPHADVVHVSCDVEVARVLVPGRDRPTRRRAGSRR